MQQESWKDMQKNTAQKKTKKTTSSTRTLEKAKCNSSSKETYEFKEMNFRGMDFSEVTEYLKEHYPTLGGGWPKSCCSNNCNLDQEHEDINYLKSIALYQQNFDFFEKVFRTYLNVHVVNSKKYRYSWPVMKGLLKIEDKETFIKYFLVLFEYMWI